MRTFEPILLTIIGLFVLVGHLPGQAKVIKGPWLQDAEPYAMTIMWETDLPTETSVFYGATSTFMRKKTNPTPVTIHEMKITGVRPDKTYYYRIANLPGLHRFTTAPGHLRPFRFVAYGDTRTGFENHTLVCRTIAKSNPELIIHVGDIVDNGLIYSQWFTEWYQPMAELIDHIPMYPVLGNHEFDTPYYYNYFSLPQGSGTEAWYSFTRNGVLFVGLDSNRPFDPESEQYKWLDATLQTNQPRFKVVTLHHPPFSSGMHNTDPTVLLAKTHLPPLFTRHGVDLVCTGHDHHYERSFHEGIQYVVTGGGGAPLRDPINPNPNCVVKGMYLHHCSIDVAGQILFYQCLKADGEQADKFVIDKDPTNAPPTTTITTSGVNQPSGPSLTCTWSDPDGLTDLVPASLRVHFGGPWGHDITLPLLNIAASSNSIVKFESPDHHTLRLTISGIPLPAGVYHWVISAKDQKGVPTAAHAKFIIETGGG